MSCYEDIIFVHQNGRSEAVGLNALRDLRDLLLGMCSGIASIGFDGADGQILDFMNKAGAVGTRPTI